MRLVTASLWVGLVACVPARAEDPSCAARRDALATLEARAPKLREDLKLHQDALQKLRDPRTADAAEELEKARQARISAATTLRERLRTVDHADDEMLQQIVISAQYYGATLEREEFWMSVATEGVMSAPERNAYYARHVKHLEGNVAEVEAEQVDVARRIALLRDTMESLHCPRFAEPEDPDARAEEAHAFTLSLLGAWHGVYTRKDTGATGLVTTNFVREGDHVGGTHYSEDWKLEDVSITRETITFSHRYGDTCRATHVLTIEDAKAHRGTSEYTVTCRGEGSHQGTITYGR